MSDEQRSGDEILELTEAMAEAVSDSELAGSQIPPPPPLPPRPSSPPAQPLPTKPSSPPAATKPSSPPAPPPEALRASVPSPPPAPAPVPVSAPAASRPAPQSSEFRRPGGSESSGVTTTPIHRISSPPAEPSLSAAQRSSSPPPEQSAPVEVRNSDAAVPRGDSTMPIAVPAPAPPALAVVVPPMVPVAAPPVPAAPFPPLVEVPPLAPPIVPLLPLPDTDSEDVDVPVDVDEPVMPPRRAGRSEEDEEEIDLAEAEEMTARRRTAPPPLPAPGAPARPARMRRRRADKEWWADIFDDDYLALLPEANPRDERREVDYIERGLGLTAGSLVLDLACGNGRNTVAMARRGYRMVGVDLSLPMLARAGEAAQAADQKINFIHGDMRDLGFDKTFDGVFCVGTSFGYFDDATNLKVIEGVARALRPGGQFIIEVANRDFALERQPSLTWFEGAGSVCMEETEFNYHASRLLVTRQVIFNSDGRQTRYELSIRLYSLHEIIGLLQKVGFTIVRVDGHLATPGAFFGVDSAHIAVLAKKS